MLKASTASTRDFANIVLENVSDIIIITNLEFCIEVWNKVAEQFFGIDAKDAIGQRLKNLISFQFYGTTVEKASQDLEENEIWRGELSFTHKDGGTFYILQTVKYLKDGSDNRIGVLAIGRDITKRKNAEAQLEKSELFYRALIGNSLDLMLLLNADGEITFNTPSVTRILGYDGKEILHTNAFQYIHPDDVAWAEESFQREVGENPEIKFIIVRLLRKNGDWLWCMVRGHNLLNNPAINAIAIYIHDDTPRRKASEALKESEKRFRKLIKDLPIGVLLQDQKGNIELANDVMYKLFHVYEDKVKGFKIWELYSDVIHEDGSPFLQTERPTFIAMETRRLVKDVVMGVWLPHRKKHLWLMISADPILDENGKLIHVVSSFVDITERKKLEEKSLAEKMAHQRQLAQATIDGQEKERLEIGKELHDNIGQQLTTIKLFLDLAKTTADEKTLTMVNTASKGVLDVINELRSMSRTLVPPTLRDLGFIDSVNDLIDSLRPVQAISIELDYFEFDEDLLAENKKLALFRIIQEQLNNIIKHAAASNVWITLRLLSENVLLQIKDNGNGFDVTKIRNGLGLTNITNRTAILGGKVKIESSPGTGCTMNVLIPHSFTTTVLE